MGTNSLEYSRKWREQNKQKILEYRRDYYKANPDKNAKWASDNHTKRLNRYASWDVEFTNFVTEEAHHVRGMRDTLTNIKWEVDHVIPLCGKIVSGLHVWNNLQVIPLQHNRSKGNKLLTGEVK